jgi:hypothetical protein
VGDEGHGDEHRPALPGGGQQALAREQCDGSMRRLKNTATVILRLLGVAVVLALIMLLVEVVAGVFLSEIDALFR